jgi:hypothetical protein
MCWEPNPGEFQKIAIASFPSGWGHGDLAVAPARVSDVREVVVGKKLSPKRFRAQPICIDRSS